MKRKPVPIDGRVPGLPSNPIKARKTCADILRDTFSADLDLSLFALGARARVTISQPKRGQPPHRKE